jgi:hypothetical protein
MELLESNIELNGRLFGAGWKLLFYDHMWKWEKFWIRHARDLMNVKWNFCSRTTAACELHNYPLIQSDDCCKLLISPSFFFANGYAFARPKFKSSSFSLNQHHHNHARGDEVMLQSCSKWWALFAERRSCRMQGRATIIGWEARWSKCVRVSPSFT